MFKLTLVVSIGNVPENKNNQVNKVQIEVMFYIIENKTEIFLPNSAVIDATPKV